MNKQVDVGVDEKVKEAWREKFKGVDVRWCIVDGFILYWDKVSWSRPRDVETDQRLWSVC